MKGRPRGRRRPASPSRRRPRTGGRCASARPAASSARRGLGRWIARVARSGLPRRTDAEHRARVCAGAPAHGLGAAVDRRARPGSRTRRSMRCCAATACRAPPSAPSAAVCRYEWPCPGDLLHMDVKRYPRFSRPGHAVTGDRTRRTPRRSPSSATTTSTPSSMTTAAWPTASCSTTSAPTTVTAFVKRALAWFAERGITTPAADDRRRLELHPQPRPARAAQRPPASATSSPRPTRRAGTARSSAFTRPWNANGPRACATATSHARNQALPHWLRALQRAQAPQLHRRPTGVPPL